MTRPVSLALALLALAVPALAEDPPEPRAPLAWRASLPETLAAARANGRPALVLFWNPAWGACRVKDESFADPDLAAVAAEFERAFVDLAADPETATRHRARRFCLLAFAADGRELLRVPFADRAGAGDPAALARDLRLVLAYARAQPGEGIALPAEGRELLGLPAPAWRLDGWLRGGPFTLEELRGRVVLIRFFTHTCEFCAASMPGFEELHRRYGDQGLVVLGFFHPKPFGAAYPQEHVEGMLARWQVNFPIALDTQWATLKTYWLDRPMRSATSASFLVDRQGVLRWLHPGPELHPGGGEGHEDCQRQFAAMEAAVRALLKER